MDFPGFLPIRPWLCFPTLLCALGALTVTFRIFPELNGVEQELINRCEAPENAEKFASIMRAYSAKAVSIGSGNLKTTIRQEI